MVSGNMLVITTARISSTLGGSHSQSMWALLPPQPLKPWPPTTKPPPHRHSTTAHDFQEMGILGRTVITALKSDEPENRNSAKSKPKATPQQPQSPQQKQESEEKQQQRQISGADVLMALQRATSKKAKKTKVTANSKGGKFDNSGKENEGTPNFSNVRSLRVKAEWNDRLEELERRLQELLHI